MTAKKPKAVKMWAIAHKRNNEIGSAWAIRSSALNTARCLPFPEFVRVIPVLVTPIQKRRTK